MTWQKLNRGDRIAISILSARFCPGKNFHQKVIHTTEFPKAGLPGLIPPNVSEEGDMYRCHRCDSRFNEDEISEWRKNRVDGIDYKSPYCPNCNYIFPIKMWKNEQES